MAWFGWERLAAGLARYEKGEFSWLRKSDGLVSDAVTSLYEDREGSLWVGTQNGLSQITDVKFPIYSIREGLPGASVGLGVPRRRKGGLWITTDRGLAYVDGQKVTSLTNNTPLSAGLVQARLRGPQRRSVPGQWPQSNCWQFSGGRLVEDLHELDVAHRDG